MKIEVQISEQVEAKIIKDFLQYLWTKNYKIIDKDIDKELSMEKHFGLLNIYFSKQF